LSIRRYLYHRAESWRYVCFGSRVDGALARTF
jgi:hypothetical protein